MDQAIGYASMAKVKSSAAHRIAFVYSAAFALAVVFLGFAMYLVADADFRRQQDGLVKQEAANLAQEYNDGGLPDIARAIATREAGGSIKAFGYALFDRSGRRVAGSLDTPRPAPGVHTIVFRDPTEGLDSARAETRQLGGGYRLVVARDTEIMEGIDRTIILLFGAAFVLVVAFGIVGALALGGYLQRRLEGISGVARAIMAGDMAQRVSVGGRGDEFDAAGAALNTMLDRIEQLMDNLRQVSSDVAHDLRTPLLRLRNQLEQVGKVDGAAARAIELGDAVLALFGSLLRIAEVEGGGLARTFVAIDLSYLVSEIAESFAPAFADGGRCLAWSIAPDVTVLGDRELIAQALVNLLDNARLHTPLGTKIDILLVAADDTTVRLEVCDNGPGVPLSDHARILQRFARGEASRTTPGNGLGLSLVAAVASAHGGKVVVSDNHPGLRVSLALPKAAG
ncbi:ATP-binding protein [Sphingomonas sp. MMS24-J45]|uniref:sensor histidine kinase n=1 Tax=Sphingomonas sp. MMS24-J45 TaxID=3238806 RepID=UPI00384B8A40